MFFTSNPGREKNSLWCPAFYSQLLCCLAFALLLIATLPSAVQADTTTVLDLGGNLGTSSSSSPITETDIRAGYDSTSSVITIILKLTGNTWTTDVVGNPAKKQTLIDSFTSNGEMDQWSQVISSGIFSRDDDNNITITLPATGYYILADQTITVNIAPSLLADYPNTVPEKSFMIKADRQATSSSTITSASDIVKGGKIIRITLTNDTWVSDTITKATKRDTLFGSLSASSLNPSDDSQWNNVINTLKAAPDPKTVLALSDDQSTLTITLPAVPDYRISALQTITLASIDASWLQSGNVLASSLTFTIDPSFSTATLEGTIITNPPTETKIGNGGETIIITLSNNTWLALNQSKIDALVDSFTATSDTTSWNLVKKALKVSGVVRSSDKVITITLPSVIGYNISADQTITLNIPSTLLANNYPVTITPNTFTITAGSAVTISGTATPLLTEADIVTGGKSIDITLTSEAWVKNVITTASIKEALIDGFSATGTDNNQWTTVREAIKVSAGVTRVSDTVVTINLPSMASFNISGPLTVSLLVPGIAVTGGNNLPLVVTAFTVSPVDTQSAKLTGSAIIRATEADIVSGGKTIIITLNKDVWASDVATDQNKRNLLISGFSATGMDSSQWNTTMVNILKTNSLSDSTVVVRTSDTVVTITLPPVPTASDFKLSEDITVSLSIPNLVLTTASGSVQASSGFTISAITAVLNGTAIDSPPDSNSIVTGGKTITITLNNATWVTDVVSDKLNDLLNGFVANSDKTDWDSVIAAIKANPANVKRTSNTVITIKLPPVAGYSTSGQSVTLTISPDLITGGYKNVTAAPELQIGSASSAKLSGTALSTTKSEIVDGNETIIITLNNGTWATDVVSAPTKLNALLKGFAAHSETTAWNLVIAAIKADSGSVVRRSNTEIKITLPPVPGYDIITDQTINLTIPKSVLAQSSADMVVEPALTIQIPDYNSRGTLQSLLDKSSFVAIVNKTSLQDIYLVVPVKHITSVVAGQTTLGNTVVNSLDICTDKEVNEVKVTVDGTTYKTEDYVTNGNGRKFNIGFSYINNATSATGSTKSKPEPVDAVISVLHYDDKLQSDVTIKISGSKTYTLAPSTDLNGSYSLYKLLNNSSLFTNILKFYVPADIDVQTP